MTPWTMAEIGLRKGGEGGGVEVKAVMTKRYAKMF
jgi:hypothetical protein